MKIAQIAPIIESVPPEKYGGTERVIGALTESLVKRGHEVTLFASGDSVTSAKLFSVFPTALRRANVENLYGPNIWSLLNVGLAYQLQGEFDVIHDHNSQNNPVSLPLANSAVTPVVMTLHGPLTNEYNKAFEFYTKPNLVSISKKQREPSPNLNYIANIYHGLNMNHHTFSFENDGYLLFVGRIHIDNGIEEKGLLNAIEIAEKVKMPLLIAAKVDYSIKENTEYFNNIIRPHLSDQIRWLGEIDEPLRNKLMSRAYALLHTINFAEPFGLTLIEAMSCGCPVIAFDKGSIPEIILNNKTGFVVKNTEEAISKLPLINNIYRVECRNYALKNFSADRMAADYEKVYEKVLRENSLTRLQRVKKEIHKYADMKFAWKLVKKLQNL